MITLLPEKKGTFLRASLCDSCNFSCEYCAKDMGMENHTSECVKAGLLSAEEYSRNPEKIAAHGFEIISFTGGEPVLCKDFADIAQAAGRLFRVVEITTNGSKLPEHMETIRKYVDVLKISVDAADDALRVKITRQNDAKDTLHIVEMCCRAGIAQIGLNFVYMKQNAEELPKLITFVKRLNRKYNCNIYQRSGFVLFQRKRCFLAGAVQQFEKTAALTVRDIVRRGRFGDAFAGIYAD